MKYVFLKSVDSTQSYIKEQLRENNTDIIVRAEVQECGRGRSGRNWSSPNGGLWFSFDTAFSDDMITIAVGVAVRKVCEEVFKHKVLLKWPNDLILEGKKVAGILCERCGDRVVIGIGINTNVSNIEIENSTSFLKVTNKKIDNEELMYKIIDNFFEFINKNDEVINEFRKNMAFIGEEKYVSAIKKMAKIIGVSDEGHLIIEDEGNTKEVFIGEILR